MLHQKAFFNLPDPAALAPEVAKVLDGVLAMLTALPAHRYPDKSENQRGKDILQSMLNEHIRQELREQAWECEVPAYVTRSGSPSRDRCDFGLRQGRHRLLMEVEFGNGASNERNLSKFQAAYLSGELDLGVYIAACSKLAKRIDSGLTVFETICRDLNDYPIGFLTCPLVIIGLEVDEANVVDWSSSGVAGPGLLSGNGNMANLYHFIEQFRDGIVLEHICKPLEPSVQKRAKKVSGENRRLKPKKSDPGPELFAQQLGLL